MASFTFAQLEGLAIGAGVSGSLAPTMAAIALAESGGCQYALACTVDLRPVKQCRFRDTTGQRSPECSYGLWQINMVTASPPHPELFDPHMNAAAMASKLLNQNLGAWTTYTDGSYKQFLPGGRVVPVPVTGGPGSVSTLAKPAVNYGTHVTGSWAGLMRTLSLNVPSALARARRSRHNLRRVLH